MFFGCIEIGLSRSLHEGVSKSTGKGGGAEFETSGKRSNGTRERVNGQEDKKEG